MQIAFFLIWIVSGGRLYSIDTFDQRSRAIWSKTFSKGGCQWYVTGERCADEWSQ